MSEQTKNQETPDDLTLAHKAALKAIDANELVGMVIIAIRKRKNGQEFQFSSSGPIGTAVQEFLCECLNARNDDMN